MREMTAELRILVCVVERPCADVDDGRILLVGAERGGSNARRWLSVDEAGRP